MKKIIGEFKEFALKGNMLDMAVGIVIGAAFGTVVKSLVDDIIMPVISGIFRIPDFSNLFVTIGNKTGQVFTSVDTARGSGESVLAYGLFINSLLAFTLVAFALFMVIKAINKVKREAPQEVEVSKGPSEVELLTEIRDSLKR